MHWGDLTFYEWLGIAFGVIGLLPMWYALSMSNQVADELRRGKRTPEDLDQIADDAISLHHAIGFGLLAYVLFFATFQLTIG